jgi:hypothetical protein
LRENDSGACQQATDKNQDCPFGSQCSERIHSRLDDF